MLRLLIGLMVAATAGLIPALGLAKDTGKIKIGIGAEGNYKEGTASLVLAITTVCSELETAENQADARKIADALYNSDQMRDDFYTLEVKYQRNCLASWASGQRRAG